MAFIVTIKLHFAGRTHRAERETVECQGHGDGLLQYKLRVSYEFKRLVAMWFMVEDPE